jgi:hypothetical protein
MKPLTWDNALRCLRDCVLAVALALAIVCTIAAQVRADEPAPSRSCPNVATLASIEAQQHVLSGREAVQYLEALGIVTVTTTQVVLWNMGNAVALFGVDKGCLAWRIVVPMAVHERGAQALAGRPVNY